MKEEYRGFTINIEQDDSTESPREWDNMGKMVCFHKGYKLGDKHNYDTDNYASWEELKKALVRDGALLIAPLFLYDHSGLRIKIGSFQGLLPQGHAEFDSMQVGFIYTTKQDILQQYQVKKLTTKVLQQAQEALEQEVNTYDQFISGDVYYFMIDENPKVEYTGDSCGGFYGYEEALQAAKDAIDYTLDNKPKARNKSILSRVSL